MRGSEKTLAIQCIQIVCRVTYILPVDTHKTEYQVVFIINKKVENRQMV